MEKVRNYEALIYELLGKVTSDWNYNNLKGWLIFKSLESKEPELAQWLREHGTALGADAEVRRQLGCLAGLERGELAEVAGELVKIWEPEVDKSAEWFDRGNQLYELGRYEEAIASYEQTIELKPNYHEAWCTRGNALCNLGRYEDAIASYERAIEFKPDYYQAWSNRGNALGDLGRYDEAISSFERAIEFKPDFHEAWRGKGAILCDRLREYKQALDCFDRAIKIQPDDHIVWQNRGIALGNLGLHEEAIASFERACELKPDFHQAWSNRGNALDDLGRYEETLASFERACELKPDFHHAWYSRGIALGNSGRHQEAIVCFERACELKPDFYEAWSNRGVALGCLDRYEEEIASFERACELKPDFHHAWYSRGNALGNVGRYQEAIVCFERACELKPDFPQAWYSRGIALANLGRYEEAIPSINQAIELKPDDHQAWRVRGIALADLGRYEEAIASFDRAIELKPNFHQAWSNRGNALGNLGRYDEAIASINQAIELQPDYYETWSNRGDALGSLGRHEEAIASFERACELKPDYHQAWHGRGVGLDNLGRYEEAIVCFDRACELKPDYHQAWHGRGNALGSLGRYDEAISSFERAIELKPDYHQAWCGRGVSLGNIGRYDEAIACFERAIELKPDFHQAWRGKGAILCDRLRKYKQALDCFDRAIKIQPDDHIVWQNRGIAIRNLHGYQPQVNSLNQVFKHIHSETHPEGWGFIQHQIGQIHYQEGINQLFNYRKKPQPYYHLALTNYNKALQTLSREDFPKLRIETLIDTAKVHLAQHNTPAARECQIEAVDILRDLLNAEPTFAEKKRLQIKYVSLSRLDVDLLVASGDNIRALQAAELDKNNHLTWLLSALAETTISPSYAQMQQLLTTAPGDRKTGIVYWHLSPDNITTFILHSHKAEPAVLTSPSIHLQNWLKTYDSDNLDAANWQELTNILQISEINHHLDGIEHLILIPHRDLHRLPLHIYWQQLTTTYLPSIQIGLNLQAKPQPKLDDGLLLIESPAYHATTTQTRKDKPLSILPNAEIEAAILEYLLQPKTIIRSGAVSNDRLHTDLNRPHYYGHFNGHAYHDARRPQDSSLILDGDEVLACEDLAQIDLQPYHLISLCACQTGVTTHQTIDTEYVGLVSAFLSRGTNYVVSTLWSVKDLPSSLLMMTFYMYIKEGTPAPLALRQAAGWLQNLTHAKEAEFHGNIYQWLAPNSSTARSIERNRQNATATAQDRPEEKPYSNPKYWAAFTISGGG